jgi:hypothetical protein
LIFFVLSNMAKEWCAEAAPAEARIDKAVAPARNARFLTAKIPS